MRFSLALKLKTISSNIWIYSIILAICMFICGLYTIFVSNLVVVSIGISILIYAIIDAIEDITYEIGVTQSFYFTFSVANRRSIDDVTFTVNYTYPQEISDHNTTEDVHLLLVKRDGSRTITGVLSYSGPRDFSSESGYVLVSKDYVDKLIAKLKADNNLK